MNNSVLLAIPMFVVAGNIMTRGSIAAQLVNVMRVATQWLPGSLAVATILSCAVFAAISGSSPVTLLAVGAILYPALLKEGIWSMMLPVILLGGIYSGYFSPTEAAAVALGYALLIEVFIHREMKLTNFYGVAVDTSRLLGTLFPIVAVARSIKSILTIEQVPQALAAWGTSMVSTKVGFLLAVKVLLLLVGCFVDVVAAILVLAPLLLGEAQAYGIDPIHFGIIMVINLEVGFLTPPVGLNLIVAITAFKEKFGLICRSVLPFITLIIIVLMLVTFIPEISLFLVK